jgi:hypothetical protein
MLGRDGPASARRASNGERGGCGFRLSLEIGIGKHAGPRYCSRHGTASPPATLFWVGGVLLASPGEPKVSELEDEGGGPSALRIYERLARPPLAGAIPEPTRPAR